MKNTGSNNQHNVYCSRVEAELEAEEFFENIEREENMKARMDALYHAGKSILYKTRTNTTLREYLNEQGVFTQDEIKTILGKLEDIKGKDNNKALKAIDWTGKVARARKSCENGYPANESVVSNLLK